MTTHATVAPKLVGALASGLKVLRYLAQAEVPVGVSQVARELDLNPSTCFNLLRTLVHEELVEFDPTRKTYTVALGLVELARGTLERASFVRLVRPHLEALAARHRVLATLCQCVGKDRVVLVGGAEHDAAIRMHMNIGQRLPRYLAALGRCMAAHSGLSRAALRQHFERLRWEQAPSFETYWREVELARKRGYAVDAGCYVRGVTTAAAPVLGADGRPVMAISAAGFSAQFKPGELRALCEDLRERAHEVSQAFAGGREQAA